tara:strand:+ start:6231 stop:6623 length:393 start_codon:yes stop_codon:yes gene_type:complete
MTTLEAILIIILWVGYGLFAVYRTDLTNLSDRGDKAFTQTFMVFLAPLIFIWRALVGTCIQYDTKILLGSPLKKETKVVKVYLTDRIVNNGITPGDLITIDEAVHAAHCSEYTCKYGDPQCPVVYGISDD